MARRQSHNRKVENVNGCQKLAHAQGSDTEFTRRQFLSQTAFGLAALAEPSRGAGPVEASASSLPPVKPSERLRALPERLGNYYEATVPDTLDLAERGRLGLSHFSSVISEEDNYEMRWAGNFDRYGSPSMVFYMHPLNCCQAKAMEAMAMLRVMSGSQQDLKRETKMVEMLASFLGDDGLYWIPRGLGPKPWLPPEDSRPYAYVLGQGRMIGAMMAWYQYNGDPVWKERIDRLVDGIDRLLVVHRDDYAYFPVYGWMDQEYVRSTYVKGRGWKDTTEPTNEKFGEEGSLFNHQGYICGALANWSLLTGNKQALRLSGELVRFYTKPRFWADPKSGGVAWNGSGIPGDGLPHGDYPGVVGAEHAHWDGHIHGHINTLRAILEYANATNDARLKAFVRDGYEWTRQPTLARFGFLGDCQGCGCGRLIGLAVKLSYAGVGDYWDDVDIYLRNMGIEMQLTPEDIPYLQKLGEGKPSAPPGPDKTSVGVMEASMGGFSGNPFKHDWYLCCSPHGNMGLFYAWDGTLRHSDGTVQVNLLFNRVSPWMDVESYIPYEGRVVLRNKTAHEVFVRIPLYVDKSTVKCQIGKRGIRPQWVGRYVRIDGLEAGDVLVVEFPMEEKTEQWTGPAAGTWTAHNYAPQPPAKEPIAFTIKGNTIVGISRPILPGSPLFLSRAEKYQVTKVPMKQVTRFVTPLVLKW